MSAIWKGIVTNDYSGSIEMKYCNNTLKGLVETKDFVTSIVFVKNGNILRWDICRAISYIIYCDKYIQCHFLTRHLRQNILTNICSAISWRDIVTNIFSAILWHDICDKFVWQISAAQRCDEILWLMAVADYEPCTNSLYGPCGLWPLNVAARDVAYTRVNSIDRLWSSFFCF